MNNPLLFQLENKIEDSSGQFTLDSAITLRDLFAGMAMHGMRKFKTSPCSLEEFNRLRDKHYEEVAINAYAFADAMLKAREE